VDTVNALVSTLTLAVLEGPVGILLVVTLSVIIVIASDFPDNLAIHTRGRSLCRRRRRRSGGRRGVGLR